MELLNIPHFKIKLLMEQADTTIRDLLIADCLAFIQKATAFSEEEFKHHIGRRWSVADVTQHLYLSARPVARLMAGPREVFDQWGVSKRSSRTYDEIAEAYNQVLTRGIKAPVNMSPRPEDVQEDQSVIVNRLMDIYQSLVDIAETWSADELDNHIMPHPALDKITVREMLYFTSIHTQHHLRLLQNRRANSL